MHIVIIIIIPIRFSALATNQGAILIFWTYDLFNIYTCPFLRRYCMFFLVLDIFFGIYAVLLASADSQLYATLTERYIIVC